MLHYQDVSGWGWFAMSVSMIAFWALFVTAVVVIVRSVDRSTERRSTMPLPLPERLLAERFARGEIDEAEYRQRLTTLRTTSG